MKKPKSSIVQPPRCLTTSRYLRPTSCGESNRLARRVHSARLSAAITHGLVKSGFFGSTSFKNVLATPKSMQWNNGICTPNRRSKCSRRQNAERPLMHGVLLSLLPPAISASASFDMATSKACVVRWAANAMIAVALHRFDTSVWLSPTEYFNNPSCCSAGPV